MVQMLGVFAEFERATMVDRVIAGMERKAARGELERETVREPSQADLRSALGAIAEAMENGTASQRKALLQELVSEIRVESRDAIFPTYRLPNGPVRVISGVVGRRGLEPRTSALTSPERRACESGKLIKRRGLMWPEADVLA